MYASSTDVHALIYHMYVYCKEKSCVGRTHAWKGRGGVKNVLPLKEGREKKKREGARLQEGRKGEREGKV